MGFWDNKYLRLSYTKMNVMLEKKRTQEIASHIPKMVYKLHSTAEFSSLLLLLLVLYREVWTKIIFNFIYWIIKDDKTKTIKILKIRFYETFQFFFLVILIE